MTYPDRHSHLRQCQIVLCISRMNEQLSESWRRLGPTMACQAPVINISDNERSRSSHLVKLDKGRPVTTLVVAAVVRYELLKGMVTSVTAVFFFFFCTIIARSETGTATAVM